MTHKYSIYEIKCSQNDKRYIGITTNMENRIKKHVALLESKSHYCFGLQIDFDIFGKDSLVFSVIESTNNIKDERTMIKELSSKCELYNRTCNPFHKKVEAPDYREKKKSTLKRLNLYIDEDVDKKIRKAAKKDMRTINAWIGKALLEKIAEQNKMASESQI